ncbi:hypothetical protein PSEUBRA_004318 [Kalmanozyma brasiliensis GHG001]|uniref:Uncharacterized protein n=1 Tax=Kalmanozyma brasiliensis (strain GHG001) TaxID=1365824 RepID=V5E7X2_KALBG|nr:uncharacterized protein PSEUBRA_004318 [Kalmanozyma brasiliensis GHG001]EST06421.1 hypothetical protein PSEUBRA_004318 [Kalmanozyma brasiliensis GHG001]
MVKIASVAAAAVVLAGSASALATINTPPSITQCQPASLQWSNAQGTVRINVLPGGQVSAAPIESLPNQSGASGSYAWTVNIASGTNITLAITDDTGATNYASPLVVLSSSDSSCIGAAATGSSASSSATSSAASSSSSSRAASSTVTSSAASSSSAAQSSTSSRASSSSGSAAPAQTSSASNGAAAFSPATAGLSILAAVGALVPFL